MQNHNFRNINRVIFINWKSLESQVNAFCYSFPVIKQYTFHYFFWNTAVIWYMALAKFSDTIF